MSERSTIRLPRTAGEVKAWLLISAVAFAPPTAGTAYVGSKLEDVARASNQNTNAIQELKLAMEAGKVTEQRLLAVEKHSDDHEARIRALEAK